MQSLSSQTSLFLFSTSKPANTGQQSRPCLSSQATHLGAVLTLAAVDGGGLEVLTDIDNPEGVICRSRLAMYFLRSSKVADNSFFVTAWSHSSLSLGEGHGGTVSEVSSERVLDVGSKGGVAIKDLLMHTLNATIVRGESLDLVV